MLPPADRSNAATYAFIAHETAHQWWGNIVAWRSYRDQWLSEGFAEYSGMLYAGQRDKTSPNTLRDRIRLAREQLRLPPRTATGMGQKRLVDVGPIILGHRLNTSQSYGAYQALIYSKGALVLRMLHFLLSHPQTADEKPFLAMMTDFVERYRNRSASTEDFMRVAGEHFARTPIAARVGIPNLDWFFRQWVYESDFPSYTLEYQLDGPAEGPIMLTGTIRQENVPAHWVMALPVVLTFTNNQIGRAVVRVEGAESKVELKLPLRPMKVELDPLSWILSERTTTKSR
jgi:aminopeptidase N